VLAADCCPVRAFLRCVIGPRCFRDNQIALSALVLHLTIREGEDGPCSLQLASQHWRVKRPTNNAEYVEQPITLTMLEFKLASSQREARGGRLTTPCFLSIPGLRYAAMRSDRLNLLRARNPTSPIIGQAKPASAAPALPIDPPELIGPAATPVPVFGGCFVGSQLKIQTLVRSPARTIRLPWASTLSDFA